MLADEHAKHADLAKKKQEAETLKVSGNGALKQKDYTTAITHYTNAITLDPSNHVLFANRSAAMVERMGVKFLLLSTRMRRQSDGDG